MNKRKKLKQHYRPIFDTTPSGMRYLKGFAFVRACPDLPEKT